MKDEKTIEQVEHQLLIQKARCNDLRDENDMLQQRAIEGATIVKEIADLIGVEPTENNGQTFLDKHDIFNRIEELLANQKAKRKPKES